MKIVIGIQTCNRVSFTKETIESVIKWNPEAKDMPWVVSDDGSVDETRAYIEGLSFINEANFYPKQTGITGGLQRLVALAVKYGDVILYLQNDWRQVRMINFKAIEKFYEERPNAGHIQTIKYKGEGNNRPSSTAMLINLHTREKIITGIPIKMGNEEIIPGNWHYADIPGFTNLKVAVKMFDNMVINRDAEGIRNKNIHKTGCDNYLLADQPYRNIDYNSANQTAGRMY